MKIRNYFAATLLAIVCLVVVNNDAFAQQQQQPKKKHQTEQPSWMTKKGYDETIKNVYFSAQDMYYNVKKKVYIYKNNGKWIESTKIPSKYSNVDLSKASSVKLTKKTNKPQKDNATHKKGNNTSSSNGKKQESSHNSGRGQGNQGRK